MKTWKDPKKERMPDDAWVVVYITDGGLISVAKGGMEATETTAKEYEKYLLDCGYEIVARLQVGELLKRIQG